MFTLSGQSIEIAIAAARRTRRLDVIEHRGAFGHTCIRTGRDIRAIQGLDGRHASIHVGFGCTSKIPDTIAYTLITDVRIEQSRLSAARQNAIGGIDELLTRIGAIELVVVTTASNGDETRGNEEECERKTGRFFLGGHDSVRYTRNERYVKDGFFYSPISD